MLLASKKVHRVGTISEFLAPQQTEESTKSFRIDEEVSSATAILVAIPHLMSNVFRADVALAASTKEQVSGQIMQAFDPLTHLVQGLAYPITFLTLTVAGIHWILDHKEKAVSMMQGSAIGFIIVQMSPLLMKMLVEITSGF